jgi:hypothetical protein
MAEAQDQGQFSRLLACLRVDWFVSAIMGSFRLRVEPEFMARDRLRPLFLLPRTCALAASRT